MNIKNSGEELEKLVGEIMSRKVTSMPFDFQFRKKSIMMNWGFPENSRIMRILGYLYRMMECWKWIILNP